MDTNKMIITRIKKSTNGKIHLINEKGFYACNRAVGKHKEDVLISNGKFITCKNCLRKIKND